jgi:hypothetical protein
MDGGVDEDILENLGTYVDERSECQEDEKPHEMELRR